MSEIKEEEIRLHEIEAHLTELAGRENALVSEAEGADEEVKRLGKRLNFHSRIIIKATQSWNP